MKIKLYFDLILRLALGITFLTSSFLKIMDIKSFIISIESLDIININLVPYLAVSICIYELVLGFFIVFNIFIKQSLCAAIITLFLFFSLVFWIIYNDKNWSCNCFGFFSNDNINLYSLLRNFLLLIIALYARLNITHLICYDSFSNRQKNLLQYMIVFIGIISFTYLYFFKSSKIILKKGDYFQKLEFVSMDGKKLDISDREEPFVFISFFSLNDCKNCLFEAFMWQDIHQNYKDKIKVIGISNNSNDIELNAFIKHKSISFPILNDKDGQIFGKYLFKTPMRIVLNNSNEVIHIDKSIESKSHQERFLQYLDDL